MSSRAGMSLAQLEAKAHLIWARQRDIKETLQRFQTCVALLGPETPVAAVRTKQLDDLKEAL